VTFDAMLLTRAGGREVNEDYVDVLHTPDASCWVIADGLGGHRGGAIAAKLVVETALRSFREQPQVGAELVERHVEQAQDALLAAQRSDASLAQMRSTIVVLVANDREAVWGHVGDTRLYHLRGGRIASRTRDHSVSQALVDGGQIDERQQGAHEDRSRLLRSLGKEGELGSPTIGGPETLCRDDAFLLCTDGFWEALDEPAVEIDYAGTEDAAAWLDRLDARLRAQDAPLKDNYTAAAIRVINPHAAAPSPHDPRRVRSSSGSIAVPGAVPQVNVSVATSAPSVPRASAAAEPAWLFGAHPATVKRILYAVMAIALIALLYAAYHAYSAYATRGTHGPRDGDPVQGETPGALKGSASKPPPTKGGAAAKPAEKPTEKPAERPTEKPAEKPTEKPAGSDPDAKSPSLGTVGSLSGSGSAAPETTAAAPPTPDRPHEPSPPNVPNATSKKP
jgi:serine/threonine protein phosphatase PrpC